MRNVHPLFFLPKQAEKSTIHMSMFLEEERFMKTERENKNFLKIPFNRILALILMDIMSILVASFVALYIRFDFSFAAIPTEYF